MTDEKEEIIRKKAKYFEESGEQVHVKLTSGFWENGTIIDNRADFFVLRLTKEGERRSGSPTEFIWFLQVRDIKLMGDRGDEH